MAIFCFILGAILFLIMFHPIAFWLVFVPLILLFIACLLGFFKKGKSGLGNYAAAMVIFVIMIFALVIVCVP